MLLLQASTVAPAVIIPILVLFIVICVYNAIYFVKEREVVVIERFGKFHSILNAGMAWIIPFVDRPKSFSNRYFITTARNETEVVEKSGYRISLQNEVLDFPQASVITRDNAAVSLDAVLSYVVVDAKQMIYSVTNLPNVLSKLLHAHLRNVAATLDVDQIIEDAGTLSILTRLMNDEATRWGVRVDFVKIQQINAYSLNDVLAKKKNADLQNKEVIIQAKAKKQTRIIESEGERDSMIKEAEGRAQNIVAKAKGQSEAIINAAHAEAKAIREIAPVIAKNGENPVKYLLSQKYLEAMQQIVQRNNTQVRFLPKLTADPQTAQMFGLNTILPVNMMSNAASAIAPAR